MFVRRLRSAWQAFCNPDDWIHGNEKELRSLVKEMLDWTRYKNTRWALRAKKALKA